MALTIPANQSSAILTVPACGDTVDEEAETFNVLLTLGAAPSGVSIADGTGVGTIVDDDNPPPVRIAAAQVAEGNAGQSALRYTLTRDGASERRIDVSYVTSGAAAGSVPAATQGTACGGTTDFVGRSGVVTFAAGGQVVTQNVDVPVCSDTTLENNENVRLTLSNPVNTTLPATIAAGTILNDEPPQISVTGTTVTEGNPALRGTASFTTAAPVTVRLSHPTTLAVSASLSTVNGTAVGGARLCSSIPGQTPPDFATQTLTVDIPAQTTSVTRNLTVCKDTTREPDVTFTAQLSAPVNATLASGQAAATVTIRNDD